MMDIQLGKLPDGALALACGDALPAEVKRVEYYKDQRLMMLVYDDPEHEGDLMNCELPDDAAKSLERGGYQLMILDNAPSEKSHCYHVPLIQVGV